MWQRCGLFAYDSPFVAKPTTSTISYITKLVVTPQLDEHPHGTFHLLHADWRLWHALTERFTTLLNHTFVRADTIGSTFNQNE
eukprot:2553996-Pleurochrysis_carterae.AAC.3